MLSDVGGAASGVERGMAIWLFAVVMSLSSSSFFAFYLAQPNRVRLQLMQGWRPLLQNGVTMSSKRSYDEFESLRQS